MSEALAYAAQAVTQRPAPPFVALTADEAAQVATIAERIMPTTDTPGAREAGVIFFIDRALATSEKDALPDIRKGLVDLARRTARRKPGTRRFTELSPADQD
ncbi:MAG: gluconate 2-dehydrogenase subunit 3 family protein, partial [Gemmatimonadota bacterium]